MNEAYNEEKIGDDDSRIVLKFKPVLAPIKVAVMPLKKNNAQLVDLAQKIKNNLQTLKLGRMIFENTGNIGKNYRKHDEIGTPICITIDFESLENDDVTIRDRDSMKQIRKPIPDLPNYVSQILSHE